MCSRNVFYQWRVISPLFFTFIFVAVLSQTQAVPIAGDTSPFLVPVNYESSMTPVQETVIEAYTCLCQVSSLSLKGGPNIGFRSRYSELSTPKNDMFIKIIYLFIVLRR